MKKFALDHLLDWPEQAIRLPNVYLAGKIRQNCWRHGLLSGLRGHQWIDGILPQNGFNCVGPFFVSCDHGCFHGPSTHGNGNGNGSGLCPNRDETRKRVVRLCLDAVAKADLVFCFIDATDCKGTLFEIGYAHALGIPIVITFAPNMTESEIRDFWFACTAAHQVHYSVRECCLRGLLAKAIKELVW